MKIKNTGSERVYFVLYISIIIDRLDQKVNGALKDNDLGFFK